MELIYKNEVGASYFDPDLKILIYKSNRLIINFKIELIEDLLNQTIEKIASNFVSGEIVDLSQMRGNFRKVLNYLINDYYPKMGKYGMKKCAYLVPDDIISENLIKSLSEQNKTTTKAFKDFDTAKNWVVS